MAQYETPTIRELGSVADFTQGGKRKKRGPKKPRGPKNPPSQPTS